MAAASSGNSPSPESAATPTGPRGARVAQAALETNPTKHTTRPARSGSRLRRPSGGDGAEGVEGGPPGEATGEATGEASDETSGEPSDVAADVDDDHVETWRLVEQAQQGSADAFGQLYDRYVSMVFRFIYYRVNDRALAEDFTSETFLRALRRISTITYQGRDIGAWFMTIARNIVLDHVKSARHRLESATAETPEAKEHAPSTEQAVLAGLESETLMAAVGELGDEQRECIMLRFIHGMSVSETAQIMGKNDGAVKALQHRAVRKLAERVAGELQ